MRNPGRYKIIGAILAIGALAARAWAANDYNDVTQVKEASSGTYLAVSAPVVDNPGLDFVLNVPAQIAQDFDIGIAKCIAAPPGLNWAPLDLYALDLSITQASATEPILSGVVTAPVNSPARYGFTARYQDKGAAAAPSVGEIDALAFASGARAGTDYVGLKVVAIPLPGAGAPPTTGGVV